MTPTTTLAMVFLVPACLLAGAAIFSVIVALFALVVVIALNGDYDIPIAAIRVACVGATFAGLLYVLAYLCNRFIPW